MLKRAAEARNFEMQELRRFVHHYTKYKLNETAYQTESELIRIISQKEEYMVSRNSMIQAGVLPLISTPEPISPINQGNSIEDREAMENPMDEQMEAVEEEKDPELRHFLINALYELLRTRRVLAGAAVYGYFLEDYGYGRTVFEYMEDALEISCTRLSRTIDRPRIKIRRTKLIQLAKKIRQKRLKFLETVEGGLNPPELTRSRIKHHQIKDTSFRIKPRRRRLPPGLVGYDPVDCIFDKEDDEECEEEEDQVTEAIIRSLEAAGDADGWILDPRGRHLNLSAMFNWPDDEEEDEEPPPKREDSASNDSVFRDTQPKITSESRDVVEDPTIPKCARNSCHRRRATNPRTGEIHEYCSLRCKNEAKREALSSEREKIGTKFEPDPMMDILIAIELSKIQYVKDEERRRQRHLMERSRIRNRLSRSPSLSETPSPIASRSTTPFESQQQRSETVSSMIDDILKRISSAPQGGEEVLATNVEKAAIESEGSEENLGAVVMETAAVKAIKFFLKGTPELDLSEAGWGFVPRKNFFPRSNNYDGQDFDKNTGKMLVSSLVK